MRVRPLADGERTAASHAAVAAASSRRGGNCSSSGSAALPSLLREELPKRKHAVCEIPLGSFTRWCRNLSGVGVLTLAAHLLVFGGSGHDGVVDLPGLRWHHPSFGESRRDPPDGESRREGGRHLADPQHSPAPTSVAVAAHSGVQNGTVSQSAYNSSVSHSGCGSSNGSGSHEGPEYTIEGTLCFLMFCLLLSTLVDHCNLLVPFYFRFPISVILFLSGMAVGFFFQKFTDAERDRNSGFQNLIVGMKGSAYMNPHALFFILLPPLLYESASSMSWHVLRKVFGSSVILALPGVLINLTLTGAFVRGIFDWNEHATTGMGSTDIRWPASLLLGTILSATDPVAVVAALSELGAPKKLATLVEGESLLNDGSAVVFFFIFLDMVATKTPDNEKQCPGMPPTLGCVIVFFMKLALGGALVGLAAGIVVYFWIKLAKTRYHPELEIAIVLIAVYGTFFVAESIHTSGVLAVVALGIVSTRSIAPLLSHDGRHAHHTVFKQIGYICNQIIFFASGMITVRFMSTTVGDGCSLEFYKDPRAWAELLALYVWIHITRSFVVLIFSPVLTRLGYGITVKEGCILVYGGLRGAVGLALGLMVEDNEGVDKLISARIAFHVSGIVLLTLLVNGSTVDEVYNHLRIYPTNPFRMTHLRNVLSRLEDDCLQAAMKILQGEDWFFTGVHFRKILPCVPNFAFIKFDLAGVAVPAGVDTVPNTLGSLEGSANKHCNFYTVKRGSLGEDFEVRWKRRKDASDKRASTRCGNTWEWMIEANKGGANKASLCSAGSLKSAINTADQMLRVVNSGDRDLTYQNQARPGCYVSTKSLGELAVDQGTSKFGFSLRIQRVQGISVIVGLYHDIGAVRYLPDDQQFPELGVAPNSVGFNCYSCEARSNGPFGEAFEPKTLGSVVNRSEVEVRVEGEYVVFSVLDGPMPVVHKAEDIDTVLPVCANYGQGSEELVEGTRISFGKCDPNELYPVIEMRPAPDGRYKVMPSAPLDVLAEDPSSEINSAESSVFGDLPTFRQTESTAGKSFAKVTSLSTTDSWVLGPAARLRDVTMQQLNSGSILQSYAKVMLSFDPHNATDKESMTEIYHVLFNTVMLHYNDMHESGVLGEEAFAWLTEATGNGMDCADNEVNAVRATDFHRVAAAIAPTEDDAGTAGGHGSLSKGPGDCATQPVRPKSLRMPITRPLTEFLGSHTPEPNGTYEPIVVEYFSLEENIVKESWWERFPSSWTSLRKWGFYNNRSKVEALWAFVEAHEKVLHRNPGWETRFPQLMKRVTVIIQEAKDDLKILEEIRPRQYFYIKHFLALRVLMTWRLKGLCSKVQDGWICKDQCSGLVCAFRERMTQIEQHLPRIGTNMFDNLAFPSRLSSQPAWRRFSSQAEAWEDVDLPVPDPSYHITASSTSSKSRSGTFDSEDYTASSKFSSESLGRSVTYPDVCNCGTTFQRDALFCMKCGLRRRAHQLEARDSAWSSTRPPSSGLQEMSLSPVVPVPSDAFDMVPGAIVDPEGAFILSSTSLDVHHADEDYGMLCETRHPG